MGAGTQNENEDIIAGINITPMVDITLVLLIIFMVTAQVIANQAIKVDLPRAANADESPKSTVALVLTEKGDLFLNGEAIKESDLETLIPQKLAEDKEVKAIIAADTNCKHGDVIHLIDVIKGLGIIHFALNIERASPESIGGTAPEQTENKSAPPQ